MASETAARLVKCFGIVFPDASEAEILEAKQAALEGWDSVASLTLFMVVEEEFKVQLDASTLERFTSFDGILRALEAYRPNS